MRTTNNWRARGVTLLELLVVLMILSIVLTAAVKTWDVTLERGRAQTTASKLDQLVSVIVGDPDYIVAGHRADFGYVGDEGQVPLHLSDLVTPPFNPDSVWRGPYLRSTFNQSVDGYRIDGWGDTIIYGRETYGSNDSLFVRSYGGRGVADRSRWQTRRIPYTYDALVRNTVEGQIVDVRGNRPPDTLLVNMLVTFFYPDGTGKLAPNQKTGSELTGGTFRFTSIPQGSHRLHVKYIDYGPPTRDSAETEADVTVYPGIGARDVTMRLPVDWNQ
jgi:prepilin-type N-terminal cleavage/methylation domain-containing protein